MASPDDTTADGLRTLFASTTLTDEEAILVCATRMLLALDAAGLPMPPQERAAVMRAIAQYMKRQGDGA